MYLEKQHIVLLHRPGDIKPVTYKTCLTCTIIIQIVEVWM